MKLDTGVETIQTIEAVNSSAVPETTKKKITEKYEYDSLKKEVTRVVTLEGNEIKTVLSTDKTESDLLNSQEIFDKAFLLSNSPTTSGEKGQSIGIADLFSGCGGLSLGIREACVATGNSFESLLAVDNDTKALEIYKNNFNPKKSFSDGIWDLLSGKLEDDLQESEKRLLEGLGKSKILLAGPPCQGHSNLNNHTRRKDDRNHLYQRVGRFAEIADPDFIIIENVPAVIHDKDQSMLTTFEFLERLKYKVDEEIINLSDLGVPQSRKRHILIAARKKKFLIKDIVNKYKVDKERTIRWAIQDLEDKTGDNFDEAANISEENKQRIEYLFEQDVHDLPNELRPVCHHGTHSYYAMYGRLHYDKVAPTITTGFGSPGQGRYVHPSRKRTLTPHEAARLQFFPDFFSFAEADTRRTFLKSIGNAVPMKLSYIFGLEFIAEM